MLALAAFVPLNTRDAEGVQRGRTTFDVWWATLNQLPQQAPPFLSRSVLTVLLLAALVALAYVIAATVDMALDAASDDDDTN